MTCDYHTITPDVTVRQLVENYVFSGGYRYFVIVNGNEFKSIPDLDNIKSVSEKNKDVTQVIEMVIPLEKPRIAYPNQDALNILEQMSTARISQMLVVRSDRVIGLISRDELMRLLSIRVNLEKY